MPAGWHAPLDRPHPRDLYDVKNEGLTDALFRTLLIYVAHSPRPPHKLQNPNLADPDQPCSREFEGWTKEPVELTGLTAMRDRRLGDIQPRMDKGAKRFLTASYEGAPDFDGDFDGINRPHATGLPAVRSKLLNGNRLKANDPRTHAVQGEALEKLLG